MDKITKDSLKNVLANIVTILDAEKDYLIELDGYMGDGDLGLTMASGFHAVLAEIDQIETLDLGKVFMQLGMKMNSVVPSTMGTLIATCFMKASLTIKGKTELLPQDLVVMGQSAVQGVIERGKSKIGDKTMLDALHPAVEALAVALEQGKTLTQAQESAYLAAVAGVEQTKAMQAVHGRAAYYNEKSVGRVDPGAMAILFVIKGIQRSFCAK